MAAVHRIAPVVADMVEVLRNDVGLPVPGELGHGAAQVTALPDRAELWVLGRSAEPAPPAVVTRLARIAHLRRSREDLFARPLLAAAWEAARGPHTSVPAAAASAAFHALRRPASLRRQLAPDRRLRLPAADQLPRADSGLDLIAGASEPVFLRGWSLPEASGRWTEGHEATVCWRLEPRPATRLILRFNAEPILDWHQAQWVRVYVNDALLCRLAIGYGMGEANLFIPDELLRGRSLLHVTFAVWWPIQPHSAGISPDRRQLGLHFKSLRLVAPAADTTTRPSL